MTLRVWPVHSFPDLPGDLRNEAISEHERVRLRNGTPIVDPPPKNARRIMNLTDPNGKPVVFMPGETLPAWALPYR
ncbi:hypothetical protein GCM10027405_31470 [Arthrobacter alkaliphilus]|uniref:hypothetical protein n=1 Tax=Arthrobacter alkaliphilus TaxID=369936 RepID=UPI001F38349E|nr:hypothetical protein [Arthrobacter alkaliphilus]